MTAENEARANGPAGRRRRLLAIFFLIALAAALVVGGRWLLHGRLHVTTDNAYVAGHLVRVTSRVKGAVTAVLAEETDTVRRGDVLVRLDDVDARLALDRAEAGLAQTVREVAQRFARRGEEEAALRVRERAVAQAEADLDRRTAAIDAAAVSLEDLERARNTHAQALAARDLAQARLAAAEADVAGIKPVDHPAVQRAAAEVRQAWLTLGRTVIRAPVDGQVARRVVQLGQEVDAGTTLVTLVPLDNVWVEANFKEDQLRRMRPGQPARLTSDLYGRDVVYRGTIVGFSPGTGSVFSLLPAQNATGNWIKIVQRLPVRITLDPEEVTERPLRLGLSMRAEVRLEEAVAPPASSPREPAVPLADEDATSGADERIRALIERHLPPGVR